ncbi:hypothetical protein D9M72_487710 [compost metagenome]
MCFIQRQQLVLVGGKTEEVAFLGRPRQFGIRLARVAEAVLLDHGLVLNVVRLVADRVPAFVLGQVDVPVGLHLLPDGLGCGVMVLVRGADEAVVRDSQGGMGGLVDFGVPVNEFLRRDAFLIRRLRDLHPVLVGARLEEDVVTVQALEPCHRVRSNVLIGVANVGHTVGVRDGSGDVERGLG